MTADVAGNYKPRRCGVADRGAGGGCSGFGGRGVGLQGQRRGSDRHSAGSETGDHPLHDRGLADTLEELDDRGIGGDGRQMGAERA